MPSRLSLLGIALKNQLPESDQTFQNSNKQEAMESFAFADKIMMLKTKKIWEFFSTDSQSFLCQTASNRKTFSKKSFEHQTLDHSQVTPES